jgi:hypothetical protein
MRDQVLELEKQLRQITEERDGAFARLPDAH